MTDHSLTQHRQVWRRAALLALLCAGLAALASSDTLHAAFIHLLTSIEGVIAAQPLLGATLFIVFAALSAMVAFVSSAALVPVAVYAWGSFFSIVLLWIGWILGGIGAYTIGRYLGRPVAVWLTSNQEALHSLESRIKRDTPFGVILLFQLGLPSEVPGYVLGLVRYSLPRYLLSLGLAELPFTCATVLLGKSFVERRTGMLLITGAMLVALSLGTFYLLRRQLAAGKH